MCNNSRYNTFSNEMIVNLNVFCPLIKHWVTSDMHSCLIVTMKASGRNKQATREKKIAYLNSFSGCISHSTIFSSYIKSRDRVLFLNFPSDRSIS